MALNTICTFFCFTESICICFAIKRDIFTNLVCFIYIMISFSYVILSSISGFKTATGSYAITGIFVLPLWIYGIQSGFLKDTIKMPITVQYLLCAFLAVGRLLALSAEVG